MSFHVAIAGATGAVGQEFLTVLAERNFPMKSLKLLASARSAGKKVEFQGNTYVVEELTKESFKGVEIAFFSAGGAISKEFAPAAVAAAWGLYELDAQIKSYAKGETITKEKFPHQIANNLFSHNSKIAENGYNEEENKMVAETRKIFGDPRIMVSATCVRVPIPRA